MWNPFKKKIKGEFFVGDYVSSTQFKGVAKIKLVTVDDDGVRYYYIDDGYGWYMQSNILSHCSKYTGDVLKKITIL